MNYSSLGGFWWLLEAVNCQVQLLVIQAGEDLPTSPAPTLVFLFTEIKCKHQSCQGREA